MPRAIWKGHVSFGLVEIPVSLHSAEDRAKQLKFSLVDRRNHAKVGYVRVNKETGEEVPWEEIVKGYEYGDDEFVLLSDEELSSANPEATQTVQIRAFCDAAEIHSAYFDQPYYLKPTRKKGNKAYVLLRETLERTGKIGIAQVVIRTRQRLAAVVVREEALMLVLLRYARELRGVDDLDLPDEDLASLGGNEAELKMAEQLVETMTGPFDPEAFEDTYYRDVMALVEKKAEEGALEPVRAAPEAEGREPAAVLDLMPLLKQSVEGQSTRKVAAAERKSGKPKTRRRPAKRSKKKSRRSG